MNRKLRDALAEVRAMEYQKRERTNEIRKTATAHYFAYRPKFHVWWAIAFQFTFADKISKGLDYTSIPEYDTLAQEMAELFPEFSDDDGTARLWELLLSPHDPMPSREELRRKAEELLEYREGQEAEADRYVPF